ncbi:hypothetical protein T458_09505 [Brevibacillus panacihumi W25]|uniref:Uncharacterized protein n=1 Tax=Brevibacillus panacihumi W25 TaxID=1408254 RepID=V6M897_9BACL|nr:hypothetical protein [Brevibacillus panacihumi]EST54764.1 hypothetical protein T458_09505 [Brevibacillus panacihumi W25]
MSSLEPNLNQDTLLRIMLQACKLGNQTKEINSRMIIDRLTDDLKPYFQTRENTGPVTHSNRTQQEAIG